MFTDIQLLQIKNAVMRVLHVPGNYRGGILEMAIVADYHISHEELSRECAQLADTLKRTDAIFKNVRLNLLKWISDDRIIKEISMLPAMQLGRGFEDYEEQESKAEKSLDELLRQLKLFYARSKIIIVITDGSYMIHDESKVREYLKPFLYRKLILLNMGNITPLL